MATRLITSTLRQANGAPLAFAEVIFRLVDDTFTLSPDEHFPARPLRTTTDSEGRLEVTLVSGLDEQYEVTLPDGETFLITVADGADITLEELRADAETAPVPLVTLQTLIEQYIDDSGFVGTEVQEGGAGSIFPASIIDFAAAPFVVTESSPGHANVDLDLAATAGKPMPGNATAEDLSDTTFTSLAARDIQRRNDGNTAWINGIEGWTLIASASPSAQSSVNFNSIFDASRYRAYVVEWGLTSSATSTLLFRMRSGGADASGANYNYAGFYATTNGTAVSEDSTEGLTSYAIGTTSTRKMHASARLYDAPATAVTVVNFAIDAMNGATTMIHADYGFVHTLSVAYDGFSLIMSSGTLTGEIRVYGLRNS